MKNLQKLTNELSVLYVEDDKESREKISELFSLLFNSVDTAFDGKDALEKFTCNDYDIVITDINMPRMNGIELIENIKIQKPKQNVVIVSAHNDATYLLKAIEMGVDNFIIKPIKMQQITHVLSKIAQQIYDSTLIKRYQKELEKEVQAKTAELVKHYITNSITGVYNLQAYDQEYHNDKRERIVLLLCIDNFDSIKIAYGYKAGDAILKEIASFLKTKIAQEYHLYHIESNEFTIVSTDETLSNMKLFAQELQKEVVAKKIIFNNLSIKASMSIALAQGSNSVLKNAHLALLQSQKIGVNRIQVYEENSSIEQLQNHIRMCMPKLQQAILEGYIKPYFQAIIDNKTEKIVKYEALARLVDPLNKIVEPPAKFINIAELTGLLPDITRIMIDKSFKKFADNSYGFSINISEFDLNEDYLRTYLHKKLHQYNIDASRVTLEVLEGVSALGSKNSLEQLMALKADGFSLAIDDFGVQNSNFERVHIMEVDYIKIDGSFIKNIDKNEKSYQVVKTITHFAKSIGAKVVAEYVHSKEVQDVVLDLGIDYSQGYLFSIPQERLL